MQRSSLFFLIVTAAGASAAAQSPTDYTPQLHGTIRSKFEWQPTEHDARFEVRNARLSVTGNVLPTLSYKAEIDLSDEGKIKMLDAYGRFNTPTWAVTAGQMRVPFTIDAHRSPHQQYFANRSFIAKQVGNVRDVGVAGRVGAAPLQVEAGLFNGSGLTGQKDYWTKSMNFSAKATATLWHALTVQASVQTIKPEAVRITMYDLGAYWQTARWHLEAELLRKHYAHGSFPTVTAVDAFVAHRFPLRGTLAGVSALARFDMMTDHSDGTADADGLLTVTDSRRRRITVGSTLHLRHASGVYADLRLNYEQYLQTLPGPSDHTKLVVELMLRF